MPAFDIAPTDLANFLTTSMHPRAERVECALTEWLVLDFFSVDPEMKVMGMSLPRVDVQLALQVSLLDERKAEMRWELRSIAGLPDMLTIAIPKDKVGRGLVEKMVERFGWGECSELHDDRMSLFLDRVPMGKFSPENVSYEQLCIPGLEGNALTARLKLQAG
jgi:hypothetical protein